MILALSGGTGGSKMVDGLAQVAGQPDLTAVVNTGDDGDFFGLRVCPDLDICTYVLAGVVSERGPDAPPLSAVSPRDIVLAIDQGTTGTTVLALDRGLRVLAKETVEMSPHFPAPGWVEHDLEALWASTCASLSSLSRAETPSGTLISTMTANTATSTPISRFSRGSRAANRS